MFILLNLIGIILSKNIWNLRTFFGIKIMAKPGTKKMNDLIIFALSMLSPKWLRYKSLSLSYSNSVKASARALIFVKRWVKFWVSNNIIKLFISHFLSYPTKNIFFHFP